MNSPVTVKSTQPPKIITW